MIYASDGLKKSGNLSPMFNSTGRKQNLGTFLPGDAVGPYSAALGSEYGAVTTASGKPL
ncbi:hypothetical protein FRX31_028988, partial [Thalictrum thalictroides]